MIEYVCYCDASNNDVIGMTAGIQIINTITSEVLEISEYIGPFDGFSKATYAEGRSLGITLTKLSELCNKDDIITVYSDSKDIVDKVNHLLINDKQQKRKNGNKIQPEYITDIINLMSKFKEIKLEWIPRELNIKAHSLSRSPFSDKYIEYRSKNIQVRYIGNNLYLAQSSKDKNKYYTVDLELCTCTCKFFTLQKWWERKKCKHIIAAEQIKVPSAEDL